MQLSDHSLRQIDEAYLERLGDGALRSLSSKLLLDLKEARERLNQTSRNSSLPPSREAPWNKARASDAGTEQDETSEESVAGMPLRRRPVMPKPNLPRRWMPDRWPGNGLTVLVGQN